MTVELFWTLGIIALAVLNLLMLLALIYFAKELGVILVRLGPQSARMDHQSLGIGTQVDDFSVEALDGRTIHVGGLSPRPTLLLFVSRQCSVCHDLVPGVNTLARLDGNFQVIVAEINLGLSGEDDRLAGIIDHRRVAYTRDDSLRYRFEVNGAPYALLLDRNNVVSAKGIVNNLQQLESLFEVETLTILPKDSPTVGGNHGHALSR